MKCRGCKSKIMMPDGWMKCHECGTPNYHDDGYFAAVLTAIVLLISVLVFIATYEPETRTVTEWIEPHIEQSECLDWDSAKDKHNISGEVLLEYMINQEC